MPAEIGIWRVARRVDVPAIGFVDLVARANGSQGERERDGQIIDFDQSRIADRRSRFRQALALKYGRRF